MKCWEDIPIGHDFRQAIVRIFGPIDLRIRGAVAASNPRHWTRRGHKQCAWPIGEGADLKSCCAPITTRRVPYCDAHLKASRAPNKGLLHAG